MLGSPQKKVVKKTSKKKVKNAYRLTFEDAFNAALYLIKQEHAKEKPCSHCREAARMIKKLKKHFQESALADSLVWYAAKAERKIHVGD